MPPRARATKPAEKQPPARHAKSDGEICRACWPDGWRDGDDAATCEHGTWTR